jgi:NSS family neurotransmitter:Na+ symporter
VQFAFETVWIWICRVVAPVAVAIIFIKGVKG